VTRAYFATLGRESDWRPVSAEPGATYDGAIELDLSSVGVLVALPSSPDRVVRSRKSRAPNSNK